MKKLFEKAINMYGTIQILNYVEAPKSRKLDMPTHPLGFYIGKDGQFYVPVYSFGNTYMDRQQLTDLLWHALSNVQRNYNETDRKDKETALYWTRRFWQLFTMLLSGCSMRDEKTKAPVESKDSDDLLLEVMKGEQVPYKANSKNTLWIHGTKVDKDDLVCALRQAGLWFCWEAAEYPGNPLREGLLLNDAVAALYPSLLLGNAVKKCIPEIIFDFVNEGRAAERQIPMKEIKKMIRDREIPVSHKRARA